MPLTCPSEPALLLFALGDRSGPEGDIAHHVSECASCRSVLAELRRVVRGIQASATGAVAGNAQCLDEAALAGLVEGGDSAGREAHLSHLVACGACRQQLASAVELLSDATVAGELRRLRPAARWSGRVLRLAGGGLVAAAAVLAIMLGDESPHRAPTLDAIAAPAPVYPLGDVPGAGPLRWRAVDGAQGYRVTLFDAGGLVLFQDQIADTTATLPDSIRILPGRSYLWKVEARTGWQRWASSELVEFRITDGRFP